MSARKAGADFRCSQAPHVEHAGTFAPSGSMRCRSKLLAERRAYELCGEQNQWSLVTIQPPVVQGPPPGGGFDFCPFASQSCL